MRLKKTFIGVAGAALAVGIASTTAAAFAHSDAPEGATVAASAERAPAPQEVFASSVSELASMVIASINEAEEPSVLSHRGGHSDEQEKAIAQQDALLRAADTGQVSESDYETNHQFYVECMETLGFSPEFRESASGFYVQLPFTDVKDGDALDAAITACSANTTAVDMVYRMQQANPSLLSDSRVVAVNCLLSEGYVDTGYSAENFEKDLATDRFPFDATAAGPNDCLWGAGYGYFDVSE